MAVEYFVSADFFTFISMILDFSFCSYHSYYIMFVLGDDFFLSADVLMIIKTNNTILIGLWGFPTRLIRNKIPCILGIVRQVQFTHCNRSLRCVDFLYCYQNIRIRKRIYLSQHTELWQYICICTDIFTLPTCISTFNFQRKHTNSITKNYL